MSTQKPTLRRVLSETSRIISENCRHFLALSLLFLFPLSLASSVNSLLFQTTSLHSHYRRYVSDVSTEDSELPPAGNSLFLIQMIYILFATIFNLCALSSITHSTFHGFYGRPVKVVSSLKSVLASFFPLLATKLVTATILGLIIFVSTTFMMLPYVGLVLLGFNMEVNSKYSLVLIILMVVFLLGLMIYTGIKWYLASAVVVVESKWGYAPLKRSSLLVKGMGRVVFRTMLFFGALSGLLSIWYSNLQANYAANTNEGCAGWVIVQIVAFAALSALLSLYGLVAQTVLFVYCAESEIEGKIDGKLGEFEGKIDGKLGGGYVQVPSSDAV